MILFGQYRIQVLQDAFQIAYHRGCCTNVFIDLRIIYVNMDYLGMGCEFFRIGNHTVRESGTQRNQKITLADPVIRRLGAVHTDHAGISRIICVKGTLGHQRITYRGINQIRKLLYLRRGPGNN